MNKSDTRFTVWGSTELCLLEFECALEISQKLPYRTKLPQKLLTSTSGSQSRDTYFNTTIGKNMLHYRNHADKHHTSPLQLQATEGPVRK